MSDKVTPLRGDRGEDSAAAQAFRREALAAASELLDGMFDGADDELFAMARRADSGTDHDLHFDAMRTLRLERPRISRAFIEQISTTLTHGPDPRAGRSRPEELELLSPDELEESVAVSNMVQKAVAATKGPLAELEARLATVAAHSPLSVHGMSPIALCHAFKLSMAPVQLDLNVRLLVYKLFDQRLADGLEPVYADLVALLERHQVEATPDATPKQPPPGPKRTTAEDRWSQRLREARRRTAPERYFGNGEILDSLAALDDMDALADAGTVLSGLVEHLRREQSDSTPRNVEHDTRMLLARVITMFREILADEQIADAVRPLLERLRVPLLKAAVLDAGFFRDPGNPARQMVNELATLDVAANDPHAAEAEALVEQLSNGFDADPDLLDRVASALFELSDRRRRAATTDPDTHAAHATRAKRMAILELRQQTLGRSLPDGAKPFLLKAWGPYLAIQYLQHGPNSQRWRRGADLLTRVVDALQPPQRPGEGNARAPAQDELMTEIRHQLHEVAIGRARLSDALTALERGFEQANAAAPRQSREDEARSIATLASWQPDETVFDDHGSHDAVDADMDRYLGSSEGHPSDSAPGQAGTPAGEPAETFEQAVERLLTTACKPGMWFQLHTGTERGMRWLRFAEYDRDADCVHFANRDGERVFQRDARTFAADLQAGRSQPIYDVEDFERRLASIIGEHAHNLPDD